VVDTVKNEIRTNATKYRENYISALPIEKDALFYVENVMNFLTEPNEYIILENSSFSFTLKMMIKLKLLKYFYLLLDISEFIQIGKIIIIEVISKLKI
jgi:hypothetical protein